MVFTISHDRDSIQIFTAVMLRCEVLSHYQVISVVIALSTKVTDYPSTNFKKISISCKQSAVEHTYHTASVQNGFSI